MAINKQALIRYKVLDECFRNKHKKFFIEHLIEKCSDALSHHYRTGKTISRRQIYNDIKFMKSKAGYFAEIDAISEGRRKYYRYSDPNYSIYKKELTNGEKEALENAVEIFGRAKGLSGFEWMGELETRLNKELEDDVQALISFEDNPDLVGIGFLQDLYGYIKHKTAIKISYQSFKRDEPKDFTIHPYYLKQFNNRWFLFGENDERRTLQNLPLDRIKGIKISSIPFIPNNKYDFSEYFEDMIGVTKLADAKEETIVLKFSEHRLPYVLSKPLHRTQVHKKATDLIELKVQVNNELVSLLMSYGDDLTILSPESLRETIKEKIQKMQEIYS